MEETFSWLPPKSVAASYLVSKEVLLLHLMIMMMLGEWLA